VRGWTLLVGHFRPELDHVLAAPEQGKRLFSAPDSASENAWRKDALNALAANSLDDEKQSVPVIDFRRLTDKETGFKAAAHWNEALSTHGDSATLFVDEKFLSSSLTENGKNTHSAPQTSAPLVIRSSVRCPCARADRLLAVP
jgi:hypothetical protein